MFKGIDISKFNNVTDWEAVRRSGEEFVILRAGGSDDKKRGFYTDSKFDLYYHNAKAAGLAVGAYYVHGPKMYTDADGRADAQRFIKILQGKQFDMPVYLDSETSSVQDREKITTGVIAFCDELERNGYYAGIYASEIFGFKNRLNLDRLKNYDKWVAGYSSRKPRYVPTYGMWQYSNSGTVPGISGYVDMDIAYIDYPKIMKERHFNGY